MSKAFTRESSDEESRPIPPRKPSVLPPGAKNYLTPGGAEKLRAKIEDLANSAKSEPGTSSVPREDRMARIQRILEEATIVLKPATTDRVRFGAIVKVRDQNGTIASYRIVGVDETEFDPASISWLSPMAKALINARVGQGVSVPTPEGLQQLEVLQVQYI